MFERPDWIKLLTQLLRSVRPQACVGTGRGVWSWHGGARVDTITHGESPIAVHIIRHLIFPLLASQRHDRMVGSRRRTWELALQHSRGRRSHAGSMRLRDVPGLAIFRREALFSDRPIQKQSILALPAKHAT
jgi:hypothetical protein